MGKTLDLASKWHTIAVAGNLESVLRRIRGDVAAAKDDELADVVAALRLLAEVKLRPFPNAQSALWRELQSARVEPAFTTDELERLEKERARLLAEHAAARVLEPEIEALACRREELESQCNGLNQTAERLRRALDQGSGRLSDETGPCRIDEAV